MPLGLDSVAHYRGKWSSDGIQGKHMKIALLMSCLSVCASLRSIDPNLTIDRTYQRHSKLLVGTTGSCAFDAESIRCHDTFHSASHVTQSAASSEMAGPSKSGCAGIKVARRTVAVSMSHFPKRY